MNKKCPQCKYNNPLTAKFCNNCGSAFRGFCTKCGTSNPDHSKFCMECGNPMQSNGTENKETSTQKKTKKQRSAERRQLTILFCDLVGSTPLSERLDPEDYSEVITGYHQVAEKVIEQYGGHIAQYLGDGLLVYFGYPNGLEDAPQAGIRSGLGILQAVAQANQQWKAAGKTEIEVRIGIHTGTVVVDDHLALGETVNVAARLEGLAPHNGLVISPQTLSLVQGWFEVKSTGKHTLKGISQPMEVFQVLQESGAQTRLEVAKGRGLSPLVGREQELQLLKERWAQAKNGKGNLVLINGEAGIGKTRLGDTLQEQIASQADCWITEARCSAYHVNSAFYPIVEWLEKVMLQSEPNEAPESKLEKLESLLLQSGMDIKSTLPLFAEFLSIPPEHFPMLVISPIAKKQRIMESLIQLLLHRAGKQPILFVMEDLHWADASTLEWLNLFLEQLPTQSIFMIGTTRPGFRPDWAGRSQVSQLNLQRLSPEKVADICHHQTKGKTLPKEILKKIHAKTEGVPLFVEELCKMVLESEMLLEKEEEYELAGEISSLNIPSTLQDSLLARLDKLSSAKEIVQVGAVLGREFSFEILHAILPQKIDSLERSLSRLVEAELFYRRGIGQQTIYQFKHALIQDTAYESLLKSRRQQLHHRVANVLEHQFSEITQTQPELLAHHYTEAVLPLQAIPLWLKAGQLASQKHANSEAIVHLEKGMGLLPHVKKEEERKNLELDFLLTLGGAFIVYYGYPHAKVGEAFSRAKEIAQTMEANDKLAFILSNLITYYFNLENYETGEELTDYSLKLGENLKNGYLFEIGARAALGSWVARGDFPQAKIELEKSLQLYDPSVNIPMELTPSGDFKIAAQAWYLICLQIMGYVKQAKNLSVQHLSLASDYKDSRTLYHIYTFVSLYNLEAREWEAAEKIMEEYLPIVREFGDPIFTLTAEVYYYLAKAFQGDRKALDMVENLLNVAFDVGFKTFAVALSPHLSERFYLFGEYESALSWIEKILNHVDQTGTHLHTAELYRIKGLTLQALGEPETIVEQNFQAALEWSRKQSAKTYELRAAGNLANQWQQQGKTDQAKELLQGVYDWFPENSDSADLRDAKALLEKL